jgi:hypothetical protein
MNYCRRGSDSMSVITSLRLMKRGAILETVEFQTIRQFVDLRNQALNRKDHERSISEVASVEQQVYSLSRETTST